MSTRSKSSSGGDPDAHAVAVALKYDQDKDWAPRVAATGKGAIAEQIIAMARAQGIPIREDADLAVILGALEIDSIIPTEVYAAVAEILSYIYRANNSGAVSR